MTSSGTKISLGHIVYYVRKLERSVHFYHELLGLELVGHTFGGKAAILTGGTTHHELLLIEIGDAPGPLQGRRIGLYHTGWCIGDDLSALHAMRDKLETAGVVFDGEADHTVSFSLYVRDPDGNEVELFVDNPDVDWRKNNEWLDAPVKPLKW